LTQSDSWYVSTVPDLRLQPGQSRDL